MRFVAGRGAAAELLQAGNRRHRGLPAGALQRRAIGKMLLARAPQWQRYCWPGHRGRAAGRECHGEEDAGTVAESYREDTAGRGAAVAEILLARSTVAELLAGSRRMA